MSKEDRIGSGIELEERLVEALLLTHYDSNEAAMEMRYQGVLQRINKSSGSQFFNKFKRTIKWGIAAGLILFVGLIVLLETGNSAMADLDELINLYPIAGDKTYRVTVKPSTVEGGQSIVQEKRSFRRGYLYTRGSEQFVLVQERGPGRKLLRGHNGEKSWVVTPPGNVSISDDPNAYRIPISDSATVFSFMDLHGSLRYLKDGYQIRSGKPVKEGAPSERRLSTLTARKRSKSVKGPPTVVIHYDPDSYLLMKVIVRDTRAQGFEGRVTVTMDLESRDLLPSDWFEPETHKEALDSP